MMMKTINFTVSDIKHDIVQQVQGWMVIDIGIDEELAISVLEIIKGEESEVRMFLNFFSEEETADFIEKVRDMIDTYESFDGGYSFEIKDKTLVEELYRYYNDNRETK